MKVLIIAPYFYERHRWMISAYKAARELSKEHDVVVLTTGTPRFEVLNPHLRVFRLFDIFLPDPVNYSIVPNLFFRTWQLVRREQPDVILVNKFMFFTSFAVPFLRLLGRKVITATDTFPGMNWMPRSRLVGIVMRVYAVCIGIPILKLSTRVVIFHSGLIAVAKKLALRYTVIHNGVETEKFRNVTPAPDVPVGDGRVNVAYVGRLESVKGYDDLLAVARDLAREHPNIHFYFAGNTDGKGAIVSQYASDNIHFLGHREDLGAVLAAVNIFVLPSYSEGLPNALMEAMYMRCACIASNVGGVQSLLHHNTNGFVFRPGDRASLARHIQTLAENAELRRHFGERSRAIIEQEYTWDTIRKRYNQLFQEITS